MRRKPSSDELEELRWIANIQFRGYGRQLIPENIELLLSPSTLKIRHILLEGKLYLSIRASDYRFVLHIPSGKVLHETAPEPLFRVYVNGKYTEFLLRGGNVFSKHVVAADPEIRPGDEVLIVEFGTSKLIGVGRAVKPGWAMPRYSWGEAVRVREVVSGV